MKFQVTGKILSRNIHKVEKADGSKFDRYDIVIEEPGQWPNQFMMSTRDNSMLGQPDGPFGIGRTVTASGFIGCRARLASRKDGTTFRVYNPYLTLTRLASDPGEPAAERVEMPPPNQEEIADDIPF